MKLYASPVNASYTGPLLGGAVYCEKGVVEIMDGDITTQKALEVFHEFSVEKPEKAEKVAKEPKVPPSSAPVAG